MGVSDPEYTRLKTMIILILLIFFIYTCELIFYATSSNTNVMDDILILSTTSEPTLDILSSIVVVLSLIGAFFVFMFQIATFTLPNVPIWMTIVMLPVMGSLIFIAVYIIYDFMYDFIKALPFT